MRRPQPLGHQGDPHDDVPDGHDREVAVGKGRRDAGGQDQHPDDLHEGEEPVGHVVDVVGRGEPGEVDPGPPDGEEDHDVADGCRSRCGSATGCRSAPGRPARPPPRSRGRTAAREGWRPDGAPPYRGRPSAPAGRRFAGGSTPASGVSGAGHRAQYGTGRSMNDNSENDKSPPSELEGLLPLEIPAATYSPRGPPPKYHRRGRA